MIIVTGSFGLIGSAVTRRFLGKRQMDVWGIDSNARAQYFGAEANVEPDDVKDITHDHRYIHWSLDIRNQGGMYSLLSDAAKKGVDLIVHTAAQPSHDFSAKAPAVDFEINTAATISILDNMRFLGIQAPFVFLSTNKVYGDTVNGFSYDELPTRYDLPESHRFYDGIPERFSIDHTTHSPFGAGKLAADIYVQEYGRYFGIPTVCFRCGCLTGPAHKGVELHGFLSYLAKCVKEGRHYTVYGYGGKQVRDNLHSEDVATAIEKFFDAPRFGEVYNLGGGRDSSISVLEAISAFEDLYDMSADISFSGMRKGDHQWWITDFSKFRRDYNWYPEFDLDDIIEGFR